MRVDAAPPDEVAAGRREFSDADAAEQRSGEQDRGPDAAAQIGIEGRLAHIRGVDAERVVGDGLDRHPEAFQQGTHRMHIPDIGDVVERDRLVGQQTGCQDRQCGVLVAGRNDLAVKRLSSLNAERGHRQSS